MHCLVQASVPERNPCPCPWEQSQQRVHEGLGGSDPVHCSKSTVVGSDFGADDGRESGRAPGW